MEQVAAIPLLDSTAAPIRSLYESESLFDQSVISHTMYLSHDNITSVNTTFNSISPQNKGGNVLVALFAPVFVFEGC